MLDEADRKILSALQDDTKPPLRGGAAGNPFTVCAPSVPLQGCLRREGVSTSSCLRGFVVQTFAAAENAKLPSKANLRLGSRARSRATSLKEGSGKVKNKMGKQRGIIA